MYEIKYKCGDRVQTKIGLQQGFITCVSDRFGKLTYELSTMVAGEGRVFWVSECEIELVTIEPKKPGF